MSSVKVIRRRIRSSKNIAQITKAMEMVSASKMRRAGSGLILPALCGKNDGGYYCSFQPGKKSNRTFFIN